MKQKCNIFLVKFIISLSIFLSHNFFMYAQFSGPPGTPGCTAIFKDTIIITDWATKCIIKRGFMDIATPSLGLANVGDSTSALGLAGTNGIVSLGDGGVAIIQFQNSIKNVVGFDFAIFENGFSDNYLELALVEISSDGFNYFKFPSTCLFDTSTQIGPFGLHDPTKLNNLAGKYRVNYGTPFDISEVEDHILLNKQAITHIKITDVVGSILNTYCNRDQGGRKINDPWPTPFGSSGFDLDAVGAINQKPISNVSKSFDSEFNIYPNPIVNALYLKNIKVPSVFEFIDISGQTVKKIKVETEHIIIDCNDLNEGVYTIKCTTYHKKQVMKFIKQ